MVKFKKALASCCILLCLSNTAVHAEASTADQIQQLSFVGSSMMNGFVLSEEATSLIIVSNSLPYHYCTSIPELTIAGIKNGYEAYDESLVNYQTVFYSNEGIRDYQSILGSISDPHNLRSVYVEVDPATFNESDYKVFTSYMDAHPNISFVFCLPFHSNFYWESQVKDKIFMQTVSNFNKFSDTMLDYPQASVLFPDSDYWMLASKAVFTEEEHYSYEMAYSIAMKIINYRYKVTKDNVNSVFTNFAASITFRMTQHYANLTGKNIAIFGDSINGNFDPAFSIPTYIESMTGANVHNYSIGGATAYSNPGDENYNICMYEQITAVLTKDFSRLDTSCKYFSSYENSSQDMNYDIIILEYGLNDYFSNYDIDNPDNRYSDTTLKGGYRKSIELLQKRYPNAKIYIVLPSHITFFENGTVQTNNNGTLEDYVNAIRSVAREYNLSVIDCYKVSDWDEAELELYSLDGVHPNEAGRYELAKRYVRSF